MKKQFTRKVSFESSHHGCIMSIFSLFASHQKRHLRKLLSEREHAEGMHAASIKSQNMNIYASTPYKTQDFISPGIDCCTIEGGKVKETRKKRKMFSKARIKAFIAGETRRKHTPSLRTLSVSPRLQRLYSIHHMEREDSDFSDDRPSNSSDYSSTCSSHESLPPIHSEQLTNCCKRCKACGSLKTKNNMEESKIEELGRQLLEKQVVLQEMLNEVRESLSKPQFSDNKDVPREVWQSRKIVDALEVVNTNRELFLKILKDLDDPLLGHFQGLFRKNAVLTKSGTYPGTKFSEAKNTSPSKLSRMHAGVDSPYIQDRIDTMTGQTKPEFGHHPWGSTSAKDGIIVQGMPPALNKNHFQDMKTKIKHAFKENQKEHLRISLDAVLDKVPSGRNFPDAHRLALERESQDSSMSSISYGCEGPRHGHIKRSASVTESIERYSQLFESISQKESIVKRSDTLKVSDSMNENRILSDRRLQLKAFGRNRSLPDIPFYLLERDLEDEASFNVHDSSTPHSAHVDTAAYVESHGQNMSTVDCLPINISGESQNSERNLRTDIAPEEPLVSEAEAAQQLPVVCNCDNSDNLTVEETSEIQTDITTTTMLEFSEVSDQSSCHEEDISVAAESCITEDTEIKSGSNCFTEAEVTLDTENQLIVDGPQSLENQTIIKEGHSAAGEFYDYLNSLSFQVDARDEADFYYVRNVLQKSGFSGKELLGIWHSPDQPVDPSLFDEVVEEESHNKLQVQQYEAGGGYACSDHLLLFDLTNEVLLEIYGKTFSPCPWFGSFSAQARPMPVGYHVLEEVWGRISWHLNLRPQLDTSIDHVVARDFTKCDEWTDLQMDIEDVGLELEEWTLDDLLDELVDELFA